MQGGSSTRWLPDDVVVMVYDVMPAVVSDDGDEWARTYSTITCLCHSIRQLVLQTGAEGGEEAWKSSRLRKVMESRLRLMPKCMWFMGARPESLEAVLWSWGEFTTRGRARSARNNFGRGLGGIKALYAMAVRRNLCVREPGCASILEYVLGRDSKLPDRESPSALLQMLSVPSISTDVSPDPNYFIEFLKKVWAVSNGERPLPAWKLEALFESSNSAGVTLFGKYLDWWKGDGDTVKALVFCAGQMIREPWTGVAKELSDNQMDALMTVHHVFRSTPEKAERMEKVNRDWSRALDHAHKHWFL
ncbi:hypothetical protein Pelo_16086 [Pelomyxa schiedti]|nr:hypothetical protein Pelo_16086 [Pelomyxa schiedti]